MEKLSACNQFTAFTSAKDTTFNELNSFQNVQPEETVSVFHDKENSKFYFPLL